MAVYSMLRESKRWSSIHFLLLLQFGILYNGMMTPTSRVGLPFIKHLWKTHPKVSISWVILNLVKMVIKISYYVQCRSS